MAIPTLDETKFYEGKLERDAELIKSLTGKTMQEVFNEYDSKDMLRLITCLTHIDHIF